MIKLIDLKRNDIKGSLAYYKQCTEAGTWSAEKASSVAMLHDNPDKFFAAVADDKS